MKERPILFSGPMVRAILDGTKTQTRRVMKPQPERCPVDYPRPGHWWPSRNHQSMLHVEDELQNLSGGWSGLAASACPYGDTRERLWVRETHAPGADQWGAWARRMQCDGSGPDPKIYYAADGGERPFIERWRPSIHMPRFASRITLEIIDVRVQRLHDITEADVVAEGVSTPGPFAVHHFMDLWASINGRASWDANPWVWALSFKRVTA